MSLLSFIGARARRDDAVPQREPTAPVCGLPYSPADPGVQCRSVDELLAAQQELISRIKLCYGAEPAAFEVDILQPVRNYAAYVNLLPATADNFFSDIGGLLRLGLEVGFYALQGTDGHIVCGRSTISTRRHLEPRWRHATFLAGLCCEMHRTLAQLVVTDERGNQWPAYLAPLTTWLQQQRSKRFIVRWIADARESRVLGLFALPHIVPATTMQYLAAGNDVVVPQMLSCLAGTAVHREPNVLAGLVRRATALVIDRDLVARAHR